MLSQPNTVIPERSAPSWRAALQAARLRWPDVDVPMHLFERYVQDAACNMTSRVHLDALYLCFGCSLSLRSAIGALEHAYLDPLRRAIWSIVRRQDAVEEVLQDLRCRLLVGPSAKIVTYRGIGPFASWLRSIAVRAALDWRRSQVSRTRRVVRLECAPEWQGSADLSHDSVEDDAAVSECSRLCEQLLPRGILALSRAERRLLSHYYVSRLSVDEIALLYGIHKSTAARRIVRIVQKLRAGVCSELSAHFDGFELRDLSLVLAEARGDVRFTLPAPAAC